MKHRNSIARRSNPFLTFDKWSMLAQVKYIGVKYSGSLVSMERDEIQSEVDVCSYGLLSGIGN